MRQDRVIHQSRALTERLVALALLTISTVM
jgi:hypothetical protein